VLIVAGLVVFVETFADTRNERSAFYHACSFSVAKFQAGEIWRAATYPIVCADPMAYIYQLCVLLIFGRPFERRFGSAWLLGTYFGTAAVGALGVWAFTRIGMLRGDPNRLLDGAAPAMFGLLAASFLAMGRQETTLHLPSPMTFEMRWVALTAAIIGMLTVAQRGQPSGRFAAVFALLAGAGVGAVLPIVGERRRSRGERPRWSSRRRDDEPIVVKFPGKKASAAIDDVDDLLAKISERGMDSLTAEERDRLDAASARKRRQKHEG
jgi:membrane associated rhomboid family serine protease